MMKLFCSIIPQPLPYDDKFEMSRDKIGLFTWEESSDEQKQKFIDMEIWKDDVYNAWMAELEAEEAKRQLKPNKSSKKKKRRNQVANDEIDAIFCPGIALFCCFGNRINWLIVWCLLVVQSSSSFSMLETGTSCENIFC